MYNKLLEIVNNYLDIKLSEPEHTLILKDLTKFLSGMTAYFSKSGDKSSNLSNSYSVKIVSCSYKNEKIRFKTEAGTLYVETSGLIIVSAKKQLLITVPSSTEIGTCLNVLIKEDENIISG